MEIVGTDLIVFPQGQFGTHQHEDQHEFHYLLEARGAFHNRGVVTRLAGSSLAYSPPRHEHGFIPESPAPQPIYFVRFRAENPPERALLAEVGGRLGLRPRVVGELGPTFESIRRHARLTGPHARRAAEAGLLMILHAAAGGHLGGAGEKRHPAVVSALAYLEGSLERPVTFREVAARSGLSAEAFARLFRKNTGETVLGYLRRRRLEHGRFHLETTEAPIHRLALGLHFCDEFHFSKAFKRQYGVSPRAWRETSRGKPSGDEAEMG
ncbi:MAG: helix-turn-helix domain-containing protein [Spirochaetes bacterium]|nr:helix-turn-helix domain-containing protein [Spirochaetota bacterium]